MIVITNNNIRIVEITVVDAETKLITFTPFQNHSAKSVNDAGHQFPSFRIINMFYIRKRVH
jgi:hypothetical protein